MYLASLSNEHFFYFDEKNICLRNNHKAIIKANNDKQIYLPYFLQIYNKKHTKLRKQEYLVNNNYSSVKTKYCSGNLVN